MKLKRFSLLFILLLATLFLSAVYPSRVQGQETATPVYVEAIGEANLRSGPGVSYVQIGKIANGTRYPVIGKSAHFPWLLINLGDGQGWVFNDLVKVIGSLNSVPVVSDSTIGNTSPATPTALQSAPVVSVTPGATLAASLTPPYTPTLPVGVYAEAIGETNVRYGPGTDFPRIGTLTTGGRYLVLRRHSLFDWLEIAFEGVAGGRGWVYKGAVKLSGSLLSVPSTSATTFGYPTLTATPNQVVAAQPPWNASPVTPDAALQKLGNDIFSYLLAAKFEPNTSRQASLFLMDLRTGQALSLNPGIAYSGMSLIKIPILLAVYRLLNQPPTADQAGLLAQMMICSNNDASNGLLQLVGDGDVLAGARGVTTTLNELGLKNTFIVGPFADPNATPAPLRTIKTEADQTSADPDLFNQSTPSEMGYLLGAIYQCALDGSGALTATFGDQITITECRQMLRLLSADRINVMLEAGVPDGTRIAHKHGWIPDALGDAGVIFTPGGDYVLTIFMYQKKMVWPDEFPKVSEISRRVYNAYNPSAPLAQIHPANIPECIPPDIALLKDIRASSLPPIH